VTKRLIYTGIGSRRTPADIQQQMRIIAQQLAESGWMLRSGHADGADLAFEMGCIMGDGTKEVHLPWKGFNKAPQSHPDYPVVRPTPELHDFSASFHPNWDACSQATKLLHMRNGLQMLGTQGNQPTDMVVCWTPWGQRSGGTGQALRIAEHFEIPIFDLALPETPRLLCDFVIKSEGTKEGKI
jgi:hypothetical protein